MVKPAVPSPLRQVVKASEIKTQPDTVDRSTATSKTSTDIPIPATHLDTALPQAFATDSELPTSNIGTEKPPATSTSVIADAVNIVQHDANVPAGAPSSGQESYDQPAQDPEPDFLVNLATSASQRPSSGDNEPSVHNPGRDGVKTIPVKQPVWRQANLSLRAGIANTDNRTLRRVERQQVQAYVESTKAAKPLFNEGGSDHMVSGCEVGGNDEGQIDKGLWQGDPDLEEMTALKNRIVEQPAVDKVALEEKKKDYKSDLIEDLLDL